MADFPKYIDHGAELSLKAPGTFVGVGIYVFVLEGDRAKLQRLCDERLNLDPSGERHYLAAGNSVILAFTDIPSLTSADPARGRIAYKDIALWVPVLAGRRGDPALGRKLRLYPPYIFVDDAATMVTGREVFGLPKQLGRFRMPLSPDAELRFSADVVGFRRGERDPLNRWHELLDVRAPAGSPSWLARLVDWADDGILQGLSALVDRGLEPGGFDLGQLDRVEMTTVGLKQIRDAEQADRACYQSIVEAPLRLLNLDAGEARVLPRGLQFRLQPLQSHPVEEELGVADQEIDLAVYVKADIRMSPGREVWRAGAEPPPASRRPDDVGKPAIPEPPRRQKIAILGGGMAGLTAAFELSATEALRSRYEITLYQMGWRLGGKCASGRNPDVHDRIEEHGLHVWFGFYENAFRMLRRCYDELGPGGKLDIESTFLPEETIILQEQHEGRWAPWRIDVPTKAGAPGLGDQLPMFWSAAELVLSWLTEQISALFQKSPEMRLVSSPSVLDAIPSFVEARRADLSSLAREVFQVPSDAADLLRRAHRLAAERVASLAPPSGPRSRDAVDAPDSAPGWLSLDPLKSLQSSIEHLSIGSLVALLEGARHLFELTLGGDLEDPESRKLWKVLDTATAMVTGIYDERLWEADDLSRIDHIDYADWIRKYLVDPSAVEGGEAASPTVRFLYNAAFAFEGGDPGNPRIGAGTAIRCLLRMLGYKGSIVYRMRAGMGDVVIAPLYEVLRARGVKFELFHRVDRLALARGARAIDAVHLTRQVRVAPRPGSDGYEPLVQVGDLHAWPSRPDYDQIVNGSELEASGIDLEDPAAEWQDAEAVTLRAGEDFDRVILAIPVAALSGICADLAAIEPRWRSMLTGIKTVRTQAFQVWMNRSVQDLRRETGSPMLGTYVEPIDTYADMSHLRRVERWPDALGVKSIGYFCGVIDEREETEAEALERAKENARVYLARDAGALWPGLGGAPGAVWSALVDPSGREGPARLEAQYVRVNFRPAERYTLSVPGSSRYRLKAGGSGFANLVLAGDWIDNGFNVGCVEATVMSGMQAARAVSGQPSLVIGESDASLWDGAEAAGLQAPPVSTGGRTRRVDGPSSSPESTRAPRSSTGARLAARSSG